MPSSRLTASLPNLGVVAASLDLEHDPTLEERVSDRRHPRAEGGDVSENLVEIAGRRNAAAVGELLGARIQRRAPDPTVREGILRGLGGRFGALFRGRGRRVPPARGRVVCRRLCFFLGRFGRFGGHRGGRLGLRLGRTTGFLPCARTSEDSARQPTSSLEARERRMRGPMLPSDTPKRAGDSRGVGRGKMNAKGARPWR